MELKNPEILIKVQSLETKNKENPKIGDMICRKHENQIVRNENKITADTSLPSSSNPILNLTPPSFDSESIDYSYSLEENTQNFYSNDCAAVHEDDNGNEHSYIMVDMPRTYASHSFCFLSKEKSGKIHFLH